MDDVINAQMIPTCFYRELFRNRSDLAKNVKIWMIFT